MDIHIKGNIDEQKIQQTKPKIYNKHIDRKHRKMATREQQRRTY